MSTDRLIPRLVALDYHLSEGQRADSQDRITIRDAAEEITRLRTALATAEAERDAAHNEALERAAEAVLALVKPCNMVEKDGTKQCISTAPSLTTNDHGRIEDG